MSRPSAVSVTDVDANSMFWNVATEKALPDRRCSSRFLLPVATLSAPMLIETEEEAASVPTLIDDL